MRSIEKPFIINKLCNSLFSKAYKQLLITNRAGKENQNDGSVLKE